MTKSIRILARPAQFLVLVLLILSSSWEASAARISTLNLSPFAYYSKSRPFQGDGSRIVLALRGGDEEYDDDAYDEVYDEEEAEDEETEPPQGRSRRQDADHSLVGDPPKKRPRRSNSSPDPYDHKLAPRNKRKRPKHWTQRLASQSISMTSNLAWNTVRQSGKVAYNLIRPKHVDLWEVGGLWRLDQQITEKGDKVLASVATVELDPRQRLVFLSMGGDDKKKKVAEPFTFTKTRLGSFQTEFVAPAFLVGETPRLYGYRGTWHRKVADTKVIKLVGIIYAVKKQRFGKGRGGYQFGQAIGTFVARRRLQITEEDDDEYDDEYDNGEYENDDAEGRNGRDDDNEGDESAGGDDYDESYGDEEEL